MSFKEVLNEKMVMIDPAQKINANVTAGYQVISVMETKIFETVKLQ